VGRRLARGSKLSDELSLDIDAFEPRQPDQPNSAD